MDEMQQTVPATTPAYPCKLRCAQCQSNSFTILMMGPGHLRAVCPAGHFQDLANLGPDTLAGRILKTGGLEQ